MRFSVALLLILRGVRVQRMSRAAVVAVAAGLSVSCGIVGTECDRNVGLDVSVEGLERPLLVGDSIELTVVEISGECEAGRLPASDFQFLTSDEAVVAIGSNRTSLIGRTSGAALVTVVGTWERLPIRQVVEVTVIPR